MAEQVMTQAPGNVWKVLVKEGDQVKAGDVLFILEVMKTEAPTPPRAPVRSPSCMLRRKTRSMSASSRSRSRNA